MATVAARAEGNEKVIATAQLIVKSLATSKDSADDMIRILSCFDNRLSTMNDLFPSSGSLRSQNPSLEEAEEVIFRLESFDSVLWEASDEEVSEYLNSIDEIVSLLEPGKCPIELQSRAEIALQISMARLEEEFRCLMMRSAVNGIYSSIRRVSFFFPCYSSELLEEDFEFCADEEQEPDASLIDCCKIDLALSEGFPHMKEIADRMLCSGYGNELCQVYISVRREILDKFLLSLGFEHMSIEEIQRIEWKALDEKITKWIQVIGVMVRTLLMEEKRFCAQIFAASEEFAEECFVVATKSCIMKILNFGDAICVCERSAEKIFRILDMYNALAGFVSRLRSLFSGEAEDNICSEAEEILRRLGDSVRSTLKEFTNSVLKDVSLKPLQCDVHPLVRYVMNYCKFLADYGSSLDLLLSDGVEVDDDQCLGKTARHLLLLISSLETNLEKNSERYEDGGLQCIFLMNNLLYIVQKVKDSELIRVLGDESVRKRRGKVRQFATRYLRASWSNVLCYLKDDGFGGNVGGFNTASKMTIKERFKNFNLGFEKNYRNQTLWKVSDPKLRVELRILISEHVIPTYRFFFGRFGGLLQAERNVAKLIKYTPEDLEAQISDFFEGLSELPNQPRRKFSFHHSLSLRS